jgi:DNA-binding response OmpR family regulator/HPt (histidine-containing phosphotransfer) domain-containing protein
VTSENLTRDRKKILVVDDDAFFRQLLVSIFDAAGFTVVEARCSRDGLAVISKDIALAIVDYRLPDFDGMTFISRLREAGHKTTVVFISGTFCDAKTFNWLRNILQVSLILQKPINPNLFLQQLEGLLPVVRSKETFEEAALEQDERSLQERRREYNELLNASVGIQPVSDHSEEQESVGEQAPPELTKPQPESEEELLSQIQKMRKKLETESRIREVQAELSKAMPAEWEKLAAAVAKVQLDPTDGTSREAATSLAHQLRGTAGSLGLSRVGACAGKIEDYLRMLDPTEFTEHELLWTEIFRALADGESGLRFAEVVEPQNADSLRFTAGKILVAGPVSNLQEPIQKLNPYIEVEIVHKDTLASAFTKAAATRFEGAIIDVGMCGFNGARYLAKELRMTPGNECLPLAFVMPEGEALTEAEVEYIGLSSVLQMPIEQEQFEQTLRALSQARQIRQPRILTVDDDVVLTKFIQNILGSAGMHVSALNEPIGILGTLEEVKPDLVLLDVMMPGLSGYDVCRMLRASADWKELPVVFLTSKSDARGRAAAFEAGGDDFVSKPVLSHELIVRVQAQLKLSSWQGPTATIDELTGLPTESTFGMRVDDAIRLSAAAKENVTLAVISIENFETINEHGMFAAMEVVTALGKLLQARFTAEVLRGRLDESIFALACTRDRPQIIVEALQLLANEVQQMTFTNESGQNFGFRLSSAIATYPADAMAYVDLKETALSQSAIDSRQQSRLASGTES